MDFSAIVLEAFNKSKDAMLLELSQALNYACPGKYILETESWAFGLREFAQEGHCRLELKEGGHAQWDWEWDPRNHQSYGNHRFACFEVSWQDQAYEALVVSYEGSHGWEKRWFLIGDSYQASQAFFDAVAEATSEIKGEVLVFDGGCWSKSKDLYESIQLASWDNSILEGGLKEEIRSDLEGFFKSRKVYEQYRIPWKRGVLFLGPPGNGKTHTIKSIVGSIGVPSLYVKSIASQYGTSHQCVAAVFARARATAPCVLVLEDIDALVTSENRSFFLNELDGFASNNGILTIGTTNHPEKLDPAILERPSRFDRKYTFGLPGLSERKAFLQLFSEKLEPALQLDESGLEVVGNATDGYSFAYLKELYLSAMMRWISAPGEAPIELLMEEQSEALRAQMTTEPITSDPILSDDEEGGGEYDSPASYMRRWR